MIEDFVRDSAALDRAWLDGNLDSELAERLEVAQREFNEQFADEGANQPEP